MSSVRVGPLTLFTKTCTILVFAAETLSPGCSKSVPTSKQPPNKRDEDPSVAAGEPSKGSHGLSPRESVVSPLTSDRCPRRAVSRAATTAIEGEHRQQVRKTEPEAATLMIGCWSLSSTTTVGWPVRRFISMLWRHVRALCGAQSVRQPGRRRPTGEPLANQGISRLPPTQRVHAPDQKDFGLCLWQSP